MIRRVLIAPIVLLFYHVTGFTADEDTFLFRYGNPQNKADPRSVSMEFFKQELETRTGGRIRVEEYFGGILGTEREMADAVAIGALQGTRGGMFEDASIKFNIVLLPYLVEEWDQAICMVRSPWMMKIAEEGKTRGFHIPAVGISQGFRAHGSKKRAIRTVEDFRGLKIRVPNAQEVFHRTENALCACSPPVGNCLNVCSAVSRMGIGPIFIGALPFLAANVLTVVLCVLFPALVLWLPSVFMG